jgi:hypothetical protein
MQAESYSYIHRRGLGLSWFQQTQELAASLPQYTLRLFFPTWSRWDVMLVR